jgi:2OG-Fe(II) oxygenase superfamily
MDLFFFDPDVLLPLARSRHEQFASAEPFPYTVFDNLVPDDLLERVLSEFPAVSDDRWFRFDHVRSHKLALNKESDIGTSTRQLLAQFNGAVFVNFLEALTGEEGLIPDPHLKGGGLHQIETGGFLKIHTDFNLHPEWELDRRINVILYLNRGWDPSWGGQLELWNFEMTACRTIEPVFNRMLVFETSDTSKHGHPDPLASPPGVSRRSLALYYYSNGRPGVERDVAHPTIHFERPGEVFEAQQEAPQPPRSTLKTVVLNLVPPLMLRRLLGLRERLSASRRASR